MRFDGSIGQQLVLKETVLRPGTEWHPRLPGWTFLLFTQGIGYWLQPQNNRELTTGSVLLLSEQAQGLLRASQLGDWVVHYYCLRKERLSGLVTLAEHKALEEALRNESLAVRSFSPGDPVAESFKRLCERRHEGPVRLRLQLVDLFVQAFENELSVNTSEPIADDGAKARLELLLKQLHAPDMVQLSFPELAAHVGCCPRHLSRLFQEVVGMSFREKREEFRLGRAQELLANTNSKVIDVALESGYQSLSLFNLMFKRRFGVTPAQWRQRPAKARVARL